MQDCQKYFESIYFIWLFSQQTDL